jgi:hypothetical protein
MSTLVTRASWNGDQTTLVPHGTQALIFSQDIPATAIGWATVSMHVTIAVGGPAGGIPIQNAGGIIVVTAQGGSQELRRFRWHSRTRAEMFAVGGEMSMSLPSSISVINIGIVMSTDGAGTDAWLYEYNVGVEQFGAARG